MITGALRTGKSAIIPIIDYCLGDHKCQIPVNTIRDACSWFGIIVKMKDKRILLARREPEQKQATDDMMIIEGKEIVIPGIPVKNTTRKNVLRYLDETARVSFIKVEPKTKVQNLIKMGVPKELARQAGNSRKGYWFTTHTVAVNMAMTKERLINSGFYDLATAYQSVHVNY